jgi:hypothetical protein
VRTQPLSSRQIGRNLQNRNVALGVPACTRDVTPAALDLGGALRAW